MKSQWLNNITSRKTQLTVLVVLGLYLRLPAAACAFWFDEVWRANIVSCPNLFDCLFANDRGPIPIVIAVLTNLLVNVLPNIELVIRSTSLVSSVASIVICFNLLRRLGTIWGSFLGAALFATFFPYVSFGSQFKPYIIEVAAALWLIALVARDVQNPSAQKCWALGLCAAISIFFATSTLVFLPSIASYLGYRALRLKSFKGVAAVGLGSVILAPMLWFYNTHFLNPQLTPSVKAYWSDALPSDAQFHGAFDYIVRNLTDIFATQIFPSNSLFLNKQWGRICIGSMALLGSIVGSFGMWRRGFGPLVLVGIGAFGVALALAFIGIWPFGPNRINLLLFAVLSLIASAGGGYILDALTEKSRVLAVCLAAVCLAVTFPVDTFSVFGIPRKDLGLAMSEARRVVAFLKDRVHPGSVIFVYHPMFKEGFSYYYSSYYYFEEKLRGPAPSVAVYYEKGEEDDERRRKALVAEKTNRTTDLWVAMYAPSGSSKEKAIADATEISGKSPTLEKNISKVRIFAFEH